MISGWFQLPFIVTDSEVEKLTVSGNRAVVFLFPNQVHVHED